MNATEAAAQLDRIIAEAREGLDILQSNAYNGDPEGRQYDMTITFQKIGEHAFHGMGSLARDDWTRD